MIIAQISDTHLTVGGADSAQRNADFRAAVADINALDPAPDVIVHTGDIVQHGTREEYAEAAAILGQAKAPVYVMAGNKDDRANLRAAFGAGGYLPEDSDFIHYAVEGYPLRLVMLDTVDPGHNKGTFCDDRFARLKALLSAGAPEPVALFMHHPPFEVLVGPERFHYRDIDLMTRLASDIDASGRVAGVFCGHVHRPTTGLVGRAPAVVMPSVASSVRYGDYPEHMKHRALYFVHRYDPGGFFTTATHPAPRWY